MKIHFPLLTFFVFPLICGAQQTTSDSIYTGVWKGSSICQVRNSPCHDETVVYYISKADVRDSFNISAYKIVNGKEEEMGVLGCKADRRNNRLQSGSSNNTWNFTFQKGVLDGTLYVRGDLYRIIKLTRQHN